VSRTGLDLFRLGIVGLLIEKPGMASIRDKNLLFGTLPDIEVAAASASPSGVFGTSNEHMP
jgi:hypothetical protein